MSVHTRAIVPIEAWCYNALDTRPRRNSLDFGLFAESLIYYEQILLNVGNQEQFAAFIHWLRETGAFDDFLALLRDGSVKMYEYSFFTTAILGRDGSYSIWNVDSEDQKVPSSFTLRYLSHPAVRVVLPGRGNRDRLEAALRECVIEMKADDCGPPVEAARADFHNPDRNSLIIQAFVDDLYRVRGKGKPPEVSAVVQYIGDGKDKYNISWNVNFDELSALAGPELNFHRGTPLTAGALCNRLLYSAQREACDLYLATPMSVLVGDKLYEATESLAKTRGLIADLQEKVEFPDIRSLVNDGHLTLRDILTIRRKSTRFRDWLAKEAERDRDAIIAYHNEIGAQLGLAKAGRKVLSIFGVLGGSAIGSAIGATVAGPAGGALGGAAGSATSYLVELTARIGAEWKPVVFGNWLRHRIEKLVRSRRSGQ